MKNKIALLGFIASVLGAASAHAQVAIIADIGTTGLSGHISTQLKPNLNARFGLNAYQYSYSASTSSVTYDSKLKLSTFDALLDYFPLDGVFRLSAGLIYNGNKITATGKPNVTGSYTVNGNTYSAATAGNIDGTMEFKKVAPYLGIGFGNAPKNTGFGFSSDFGIMYQGVPKTSLVSNNCTAGSAACNQLASDLAVENQSLADTASKFKMYPVIRVGVSYRF